MDNDLIERMLRKEEGCRLKEYRDTLGNLTIGYGHLITDDESFPPVITITEAETILNEDIAKALNAVKNRLLWTDTLDETRFAVLVCMVFQMGLNGLLNFPDTLAAIKLRDWQSAHDAMMDSDWARDDSPARARRMAEIILTGDASYYN